MTERDIMDTVPKWHSDFQAQVMGEFGGIKAGQVEVLRRLDKQDGTMVSLQQWQNEHERYTAQEGNALVAEIGALKQTISNMDVEKAASERTDKKWEDRFAPVVKVLMVAVGVLLLEHGPDLVKVILK